MFTLFRPSVCFTKGILDKRNLQKLYLSVFLPHALGGFFLCAGIFRVNAKEEPIGTLPRASSKAEFLLTITGIPAEKGSRPVNPNPSVHDGISTRSTSQNNWFRSSRLKCNRIPRPGVYSQYQGKVISYGINVMITSSLTRILPLCLVLLVLPSVVRGFRETNLLSYHESQKIRVPLKDVIVE